MQQITPNNEHDFRTPENGQALGQMVKARLYKDGRLTIKMHTFTPSIKPKEKLKRTSKPKLQYIKRKNYVRTLKSTYEKLSARTYNEQNCYFVTFTFEEKRLIQEAQDEFRRFLASIRYHYGKFEYIRAIEIHKLPKLSKKDEQLYQLIWNGKKLQSNKKRKQTNYDNHYHIHAVFEFDKPQWNFNDREITKLWKRGICKVKHVYDIYGVLQYITKYKPDHILQDPNYDSDDESVKKPYYKYYTRFPLGTRIIAMSQNFGRKIDDSSYRDFNIPIEKANEIYNERKNSEGREFMRVDGHNYIDNNGTRQYCVDKIYIKRQYSIFDTLDRNLDFNNNGKC